MLTYTTSLSHNLMMDLLDLAQAQNNTFKINEQVFSLMNVLKNAFKVVDHIARLKNVTLEAPDLSSELVEIFSKLEGDKNRILQVLVNLLNNSLKFSQQNGKI